MDKEVNLGDTFVLSRTVKRAVGKVESIMVPRRGLVLINCVDEKQKMRAMDLAKFTASEVTCIDLRRRAAAKGVTVCLECR